MPSSPRAMPTKLAIVVAVVVLALVGFATWLETRSPPGQEQWAAIDRYCVTCHNEAEFAGDVAFDKLRRDELAAHPDVWEQAIRKLAAGLMPPPNEPRPDAEGIGNIVAWLEATLDAAARAKPNPGAPLLHRMNRTEYGNAVRDLLHLPIDAAALLPGDDSSAGFDNVANALSVSPSLMQAYVDAAAKISRLAVGDPTTSPSISTYSVPREVAQADHFDGLPLGTRGGLIATHVFPLDAEYEISVQRAGGGFGLPTVGSQDPIELTLDGQRIALLEPGAPASLRLTVASGPRALGAAVIPESRPRGVDDLYSTWAASPGIQALTITGPFAATGSGDTPSRQRLFVCRPAAVEDEPACAREILRTLAARAFRRPVGPGDASIEMLMGFFESGRDLRGFDTGIQYALARALVDPEFIFRFEQEPTDAVAGEVYALGSYELATRLSFFIWSSIPDDELLAAAGDGLLADRAGRERQVRRMLADPKAAALVDNFASQWLLLRQLESVAPATNTFDGNLRRSMRRETELLFETILREDRSILDLLNADYTFVDERLARHYGMANIRGSRFRRVALADGRRRGMLGHGSILTVTSAPNRTSPVRRGAWILENILGTPPPAPPSGVETNLEVAEGAGDMPATVRQRLQSHRENPDCAACHNLIDPLGFALENFDLIGQWRDVEAGQAVDASGQLWDGTALNGAAGLRAALLERREMFALHATEKLMTYALGRAVEPVDMPSVRGVVRAAAESEYRFSDLVLGIVESTPFRMKIKALGQAEVTGG